MGDGLWVMGDGLWEMGYGGWGMGDGGWFYSFPIPHSPSLAGGMVFRNSTCIASL
jgi:hypothetical protein